MTTERVKTADGMFEQGYNCAQSLLAAFAPDLGLERREALRLAATLGGGLSRTGGTCGAAMGALLVLGLRYGHTDAEDEEKAELSREKAQEFMSRFAERAGGTTCPEILTADLSQPDERDRVEEFGLSSKHCPPAVCGAAEILEELL